MKMILSCPVIALLLLSLVADQGAKGQVIPVPDTQPPIFLGHYNYPLTTVSLTYTYLSPNDCPVPEYKKLQNISVTVPRGASVLNVIEIAANLNPLATFECDYQSGQGYFLTKLNHIPDDNAPQLCQWTWETDPPVSSPTASNFAVSEVFIHLFQHGTPEIHFTYKHLTGGLRQRSGQNPSPPSNNVLPAENMSVLYTLADSPSCPFPSSVDSIPATPYNVSIQAGGSALNVMERAADLHSNLEFTVSSTFGVFYTAETISGVTAIPGCQWCLTYQPPNSQTIIVPESSLQNFVIPLPETTLHMEYTSNCLSAYQVALARRDWAYFRRRGYFNFPGSKRGDWVRKERYCDGEEGEYCTTP